MTSENSSPILFEHSYNLKASKVAPSALFLLALAAGLVYLAQDNKAAVNFFGLFTISAATATYGLWIMAVAVAGIVAATLLPLVPGVQWQALRIRVTERDFTVPMGAVRQRMATVPLSQVSGVAFHEANGDRFMVVRTARGRVCISRGDIGDEKFEELAEVLEAALERKTAG